jgi:hypothetical protein
MMGGEGPTDPLRATRRFSFESVERSGIYPEKGQSSPNLKLGTNPAVRYTPEKGIRMRPPKEMTSIINHKRYSTATATLIAGDDYYDGHNFERKGRNTFLYRTPEGSYFAVYLTRWQDEQNRVEALEPKAAADLYGRLSERRLTFEEAFPVLKIEEA